MIRTDLPRRILIRRGSSCSRRTMKNSRNKTAEQTARFGMFVALAMIMSYIETLIPFSFGVPGIKLGLANLVTMVCLFTEGILPAAAVSLTRIVLVGLTFGNLSSMLYSLAGGILSLVCMIAAKKSGLFGRTGVSIIGGVMHNAGQLAVAAAVVENANVFWYLPVLMASGIVTGALIGLLAALVMERLPSF